MKRFEVGQEYIITSNARPMGIARVVEADGSRATFELARVVEADGSRATFELARRGGAARFTERIRTVGKPTSEVVVPAEYDAIYAYNAIKKEKKHGV